MQAGYDYDHDPSGQARSHGLRRLSRLTWRATQLGAMATVGFAVLFARTAPAATVGSHTAPKVSRWSSARYGRPRWQRVRCVRTGPRIPPSPWRRAEWPARSAGTGGAARGTGPARWGRDRSHSRPAWGMTPPRSALRRREEPFKAPLPILAKIAPAVLQRVTHHPYPVRLNDVRTPAFVPRRPAQCRDRRAC